MKQLRQFLIIICLFSIVIFHTTDSRQLSLKDLHQTRCNKGEDSKVPGPSPVYFSCKGREEGFHADLYRRCKVFHYCKPDHDAMSFNCPGEWIFDDVVKSCGPPETVECRPYEPIGKSSE